MAVITVSLRGLKVRDTALRSPLSQEWDWDAILNREIYPALKKIRDLLVEVDEEVGLTVFDLVGPAHTLLAEHIRNYVRIDTGEAAPPGTFTVPTDAVGGFEAGDWVRGIQSNSGIVTIVEATDVTINRPETLVLYKRYASFTLIHTNAANTWDFDGDTELA